MCTRELSETREVLKLIGRRRVSVVWFHRVAGPEKTRTASKSRFFSRPTRIKKSLASRRSALANQIAAMPETSPAGKGKPTRASSGGHTRTLPVARYAPERERFPQRVPRAPPPRAAARQRASLHVWPDARDRQMRATRILHLAAPSRLARARARAASAFRAPAHFEARAKGARPRATAASLPVCESRRLTTPLSVTPRPC
jgi:hypothetical protein